MINTDRIGLIGFGVIGVPIAHRLQKKYGSGFYLIADKKHRDRLEKERLSINGEFFEQNYIDSTAQSKLSLCIICVKNYDLNVATSTIKSVIDDKTIILPLENGIYAYEYYVEKFPQNRIIQGYIQGSNTRWHKGKYFYTNPGNIYIENNEVDTGVDSVYRILKEAGIEVYIEKDITEAKWKKWMLNIAGNYVTALTETDYNEFYENSDIVKICRNIMLEFIGLANAYGIALTDKHIEEVIDYFCTYHGSKKTSMLCDVLDKRRTENEYIAGEALRKAKERNLELPRIETVYLLVKAKEESYKKVKKMKEQDIYTQGIQYDDELKKDLHDIYRKLNGNSYAQKIYLRQVDELEDILQYAVDHSEFYSHIKKVDKGLKLEDFPVMNKVALNKYYKEILVNDYGDKETHVMYTSGSTGIPFSVVQDMRKRRRHIADLKYFGVIAGYKDYDPMCYLRAKPTATMAEQERDHIYQFDVSNLDGDTLTDYYNAMCDRECTALMAYPSTLDVAIEHWSNTFENKSKIGTIITTSESLTEETRSKIYEFFGNDVKVCERYSNTENGVLGQEMEDDAGFCLNWASYYFELLKLEEDNPADDGELGRIVVTDLYNRAFPMIRYDTGDVGIVAIGSRNKLPKLKALYGRRMDLIYDSKGEAVSPLLLCRVLRKSKGILQWQFCQETKNNYTLKVLPIPTASPVDFSRELEEFYRILGEGASIEIEFVKEIPVLSSLKRKLIISNLKNNE